MVDEIRFEIGTRDDPSEGLVDAAVIFVNGRDLVKILREVELPFASREGRSDRAGHYAGLTPGDVFLPSPRLLGEPTITMTRTAGSPFWAVFAARWAAGPSGSA